VTPLVVGLLLLLGVHSVAFNEGWRDRIAAHIGKGSWVGLHSLVSLLGFLLAVRGFGLARQSTSQLYSPPMWLHHVTFVLMMAVFPLLLAAFLPGRIRSMARHPVSLAIALWAVAHLLSNGSLADAVLFGSFLVWSMADLISMGFRARRAIPQAAISRWNDLAAVGIGLGIYAALLLGLHRGLFGVSPLG
jgi:uncharacterized membrane protein